VTQLSASSSHGIAATADGRVFAWPHEALPACASALEAAAATGGDAAAAALAEQQRQFEVGGALRAACVSCAGVRGTASVYVVVVDGMPQRIQQEHCLS
jgi:hypothetical protein